MKKGIIYIFIILLITGCVSTPTIGYEFDSSKGCIKIKETITPYYFNEKIKYNIAELKDLNKAKENITNLEYEKRKDNLLKKFPKEFITTSGKIKEFQNDKSRYNITMDQSLSEPSPLVFYKNNNAFINTNNYPDLNTQLKINDEIHFTVTNQDSTIGGYYFDVVTFEIGGDLFVNKKYCFGNL